MAHATPNTRTEKRMVETEVEVKDGIVLMLTDDEAIALLYVLGSLKGLGELRNFTSKVYLALRGAGVDSEPMHRENRRAGTDLIADIGSVKFVREDA